MGVADDGVEGIPMAAFGITFIGIGAVMLLPRVLTSIGVAVLIVGGIAGIAVPMSGSRNGLISPARGVTDLED